MCSDVQRFVISETPSPQPHQMQQTPPQELPMTSRRCSSYKENRKSAQASPAKRADVKSYPQWKSQLQSCDMHSCGKMAALPSNPPDTDVQPKEDCPHIASTVHAVAQLHLNCVKNIKPAKQNVRLQM